MADEQTAPEKKTLKDFLAPAEKKPSESKLVFLGTKLDKDIVKELCEATGVEYIDNGAEMFRRLSDKAGVLSILPEKTAKESESDTLFLAVGVDREVGVKFKEALGLDGGASAKETLKKLLSKVIEVSQS